MSDAVEALTFNDLAVCHPGITEALAPALYQAASVCLDRHHTPPCEFELERSSDVVRAELRWSVPTREARNAWANEIEATEFGACAVCLASIHRVCGLVAIRRADTRTGADYYLAPTGAKGEDLEDCIRLEVSGVDRGGRQVVFSRLSAKIEQTRRGDSNLPALATVCGFREKLVLIGPLVEP